MRSTHLILVFLVLMSIASPSRADLVYFLVAENPFPGFHLDSYVLPLSDPDDIQHARDLVAFGPGIGERIAVATIAPGGDGVNRNYYKPGSPQWNWHVTGFLGFADFTAEIYDGWPTFVEEDVDGWMANTGGVVGFWGYTVVAELTNIPESNAAWLLASLCIPMVILSFARHRYRTLFRVNG